MLMARSLQVVIDMFTPNLIGTSGDSLREAFGKTLVKIADDFPTMVVLDADIAGGTGAHHFRGSYPNRFFQFGIAEQNMMSAAGGMAATGLIPVVTTFAIFCLRAIEQARLSIAYSQRNVKIVGSHPGLDTGPDGASAQCLEDIAAFRAIPGMVVVSPADPYEMELATAAIMRHVGPVYMRSGRSPAKRIFSEGHKFEIGKGYVVRDGTDLTIVACGVQVQRSIEASHLLAEIGIRARVVNMATIKPIDTELLKRCAVETGAFVVTEDHSILGGLGGAVAEALAATTPKPIEFVGVRDEFGQSGEPLQLADFYGISARHIKEAAELVLSRKEV
jgi:transketolase